MIHLCRHAVSYGRFQYWNRGAIPKQFNSYFDKTKSLKTTMISRDFTWSRWQDLNLRPFGPEIRTDVFLCHIMPAVVIRRKASLLTSSDMDENIPLQFSCNRCRTRLFPFARVIYRLAKPSSPLSDKTIIPHTLWYFNIWTDKASPISAIHENELGHPASKMLVGSPSFGALAQLVARYIRIVEVTGSNPVCSTTSSPSIGYNLGEVLFYHQKAQKPCNHGAFEPSLFLGVG